MNAEKLAAGDLPAWQALLEQLVRTEYELEPAQKELIVALLERQPSVQAWLDLAREAVAERRDELQVVAAQASQRGLEQVALRARKRGGLV